MRARKKQISSIDTALRIYYQYSELQTPQIIELFDIKGSAAAARYKKAVIDEQLKRGVKSFIQGSVNTRLAYEVWGIDVDDLEQRRKKLVELGFMP